MSRIFELKHETISLKETKWEKIYLDEYKLFLQEIIDWEPDYIIPVARKSCKLMSSVSKLFTDEINSKIFYIDYFEFKEDDLKNKKIVIVDDLTKHSLTLKEYRDEFIQRGCLNENIRTYAFRGHEELLKYKEDKEAIIFKNILLPNYEYNQYVNIQSAHLLLKNFQFDIDHLVIQTEVEQFTQTDLSDLHKILNLLGYYYELKEVEGICRFGVHFDKLPDTSIISDLLGLDIENDFTFKIKFIYEEQKQKLTCIPIYFPKVHTSNTRFIELMKNENNIFPFQQPFSYLKEIDWDNLFEKKCFYQNISIFFNTLVARYFYFQLKDLNPSLYNKFLSSNIRENDLAKYVGKEIATQVAKDIKEFLSCQDSPYDKAFIDMPFNKNLFPEKYNDKPEDLKILQYLRDGYNNEVEKYHNGELQNNQKPHFEATVNELLNIGDKTHPLQFTVLIDELCDFGIIVPKVRYDKEKKYWERVYRSGENHPDEVSWERTKAILAICLNTLGSKQSRIFLEKVLANFTYDFPPHYDEKIESYTDNHCIHTKSYLFGPINEVLSFQLLGISDKRLQLFNPIHLENRKNSSGKCHFSDHEYEQYKSIINIISHEKASELPESDEIDKEYNSHSFSFNRDQYDYNSVSKYIKPEFLIYYFEFFKELYEKTSAKKGNTSVTNVLAIAIGRNKDTFNHYISYNIRGALKTLSNFITDLQKEDCAPISLEKYIRYMGIHISSIKQKLEALSELKNAFQLAQSIADDMNENRIIKYKSVWNRILNNQTLNTQLLIADEIIAFAKNYDGILDVFTFVNEIFKAKCNKPYNFNQLCNSLKNNSLIDISPKNLINGENSIVCDKNLILELQYISRRLNSSLGQFLAPFQQKVIYNQQLFLDIDLYKIKDVHMQRVDICKRKLKEEYNWDKSSFINYDTGDNTVYYTWCDPFGQKMVFQFNASNTTIERSSAIKY